EVYVPVSQFYYRTGRFDEVVKVLRKAQDMTPQEPVPGATLADVYLSDNRLSDAQELLVELKQKFPKSIEVAVRLAKVSLEQQPDRARKEIDQILKSEPKNPIGPILLGELHFFSGKYQEAETILSQAPAINSSSAEPHYFLGRIAASRSQTDQALDHYQKSLLLSPRYLPARLGEG
ncbi:MAG: tetratricopeptide repeat protein, partial [Deltaproteobacteria bacterium]